MISFSDVDRIFLVMLAEIIFITVN